MKVRPYDGISVLIRREREREKKKKKNTELTNVPMPTHLLSLISAK